MSIATPTLDDMSCLAGELAMLCSNEEIYFQHAEADKYCGDQWFANLEHLLWLTNWLKSQIDNPSLFFEEGGMPTYPIALHAAYVICRMSNYPVKDIDPKVIKELRGPLACLINASQQALIYVLDPE